MPDIPFCNFVSLVVTTLNMKIKIMVRVMVRNNGKN